jgi:ribose transport system permease protein
MGGKEWSLVMSIEIALFICLAVSAITVFTAASSEGGRNLLRSPGFIRPIILVNLAIGVLFLGRFYSDGLPSYLSVGTILTQSLFVAVIAFGQGLVMLIGGLDLSIPGVIAVSATIVAVATSVWEWPVLMAVVVALIASALFGLISGFIIAKFQIPAFIITLAMGTILAGISMGMTFGRKAPAGPDAVINLFSGIGKIYGIGIPIFIFLLVGVLGYIIQAKSVFGRQAYLFGSSPGTARIAGQPVLRIEILVYVVGALASGIAGIMLLGYSGNAQLSLGDEWLIPAITAVLVGGTVIGSGLGFWQSTFTATVLLTTIIVVIQATGYPEGYKSVLYGVVILLALIVTRPDRKWNLAKSNPRQQVLVKK